ncbi:hypothetical protein DMH26_18005 [Streptomyces sp. WAC 05379]|uniref:hypothetical protein n=1 Tax=Streptomyces sp. WAC 05379 TaxID=2203207 RepID=UPI000F736787|nr:hypothetical protein [Streptomyces sp. WAC 05379]RSN99569.1 hypothetical protein DMH26_18005 [Streptomyces sp. WAC 05379]
MTGQAPWGVSLIIAASHAYDPVHQLQTSVLTLVFGVALISVGRMFRRNGRLPGALDLGQKTSGSLVAQGHKSAGVVRLGSVMIAAGCFFLFGTVCLVLGAMGVMGPA